MRPSDFAKAFVLGLTLILLNFAIGFLAVAIYAAAIEPGRDPAFYQRVALSIVPVVVGIASPILFLTAGLLAAARRPARNGLLFALAFSAAYIILDGAVATVGGQMDGFTSPVALLMFAVNVAAALLGVALAKRFGAASTRAA